jgi:hypothetical protein
MKMNTSGYQKEYLALRYGIMTQSSDNKVKIEGYKNLVESCKTLGWD